MCVSVCLRREKKGLRDSSILWVRWPCALFFSSSSSSSSSFRFASFKSSSQCTRKTWGPDFRIGWKIHCAKNFYTSRRTSGSRLDKLSSMHRVHWFKTIAKKKEDEERKEKCEKIKKKKLLTQYRDRDWILILKKWYQK